MYREQIKQRGITSEGNDLVVAFHKMAMKTPLIKAAMTAAAFNGGKHSNVEIDFVDSPYCRVVCKLGACEHVDYYLYMGDKLIGFIEVYLGFDPEKVNFYAKDYFFYKGEYGVSPHDQFFGYTGKFYFKNAQ